MEIGCPLSLLYVKLDIAVSASEIGGVVQYVEVRIAEGDMNRGDSCKL